MKSRIVTFGEIMLRLSPKGYLRFCQADTFDACFGGGEANVAVSLANYGFESCFVTRLPENAIGQSAINELRRYGVNTSYIVHGGDRIGIYYLEKGASQRPGKVIYDRAFSAISTASRNDFPWEEIFKDCDWFHITGITPALSDTAADLVVEACKKAKELGVKVSCDLNYRNSLWPKNKAQITMTEICGYVDICIANEQDISDVFDMHAKESNVLTGKINKSGYMEVAEKLQKKFGFEKIAITLRESISASDNNWSAMLYDGNNYYFSKKYAVHVVDRVGGGDSFAGGLIASILFGYDPKEAIEFATAAGCLKHSIEGDFNLVSKEEVDKLANGDMSGRIQR